MKLHSLIVIGSLAACNTLTAQSPSIPSPQPPAVLVPAGCRPDASPLSKADALFYQQDWGGAAKLYRQAAAADTAAVEPQAGLVRTLFGQEKTKHALQLANTLATEHPQSAAALEILGEAYVRSGELALAPVPLAAALRLNNCLGRAHYAEGRLLLLSGYRASAAHQFAAAHALSPLDMQATVAWLRSLPITQGAPLLREFLKENAYLDSQRHEDLQSRMTEKETAVAAHTTVNVPELPAEIKIVRGPQHGPDPGIASVDVSINGHTRRFAVGTDSLGVTLPKPLAVTLGPQTRGTFQSQSSLARWTNQLLHRHCRQAPHRSGRVHKLPHNRRR